MEGGEESARLPSPAPQGMLEARFPAEGPLKNGPAQTLQPESATVPPLAVWRKRRSRAPSSVPPLPAHGSGLSCKQVLVSSEAYGVWPLFDGFYRHEKAVATALRA